MPDNDVRVIKDRLDILDIIGDRVRLRRTGRDYVGLCPFHNEKTPSFHVSQEKQNYHCFGCGRGGDVFTFVMETEGLDFPQTLELLAARAGVSLSKKTGKRGPGASNVSLYEIMELAQEFFVSRLRSPEGSPARAYMDRRSLTERDASRFGLGWSPVSWDSLLRHLQRAGVGERSVLASGLAVEGQHGGVYDRFRGRLMFPIRDVAGRVIAFGGRLVDGEGAKYINSPEGEIYSKRRTLYLLHEARNAIRERGRSILVEGYMDALRLHLCGFPETVASLGTSLTEEQARLLKRFSDRCYICYDSDAAGQDATIRGMYILRELGLDVQVITLPSGKDPDELLLSSDGPAAFEKAVHDARPLILQHLASVSGQLDAPETRRSAIESLLNGLVRLEPSAIAPHVPELAGALGVYPRDFWRELDAFRRGNPESRRARRQPPQNVITEEKDKREEEALGPFSPLESALCSILWHNAERRRISPGKILELLTSEQTREVALAILTESPDVLEERWLSLGDRWPMALIARGDAFCDELISPSNDISAPDPWDIVCADLERRRGEARLKELGAKMKRGQATPDELAEMRTLAAGLKRRN